MDKNILKQEADHYIVHLYQELNKTSDEINRRRKEVEIAINEDGFYEHTYTELAYGAKLAWRNSNHCIGRLFWDRLNVIDARHVETTEEVFKYLIEHIKLATNNGKIKPLITIFKPEINDQKKIKIWNHQLLRYAGYETEDGVIGDPASVQFTKKCMELGWQGKGTPFDMLPLVVQIGNETPKFMEIPKEIVVEVPIEHPELNLFGELAVKWYAVPIISDMRLEIGGINYTAAPFNGWYMGTEIGARNLADQSRYDFLPLVAKQMGLDTRHQRSLWKDKAIIELNIAVLDSYKKHGVTIVDHHTAAQQFHLFEEKEKETGRGVTGKWSWLIPPVSPATTHIFHKPYDNSVLKPNYFYQQKFY